MDPKENLTFVEMLKKYTNIDRDFINIFFKKFRIGGELNFDIIDKDVAKYLGIALDTLRRRLLNLYSKTKIYFENIDYVKIKGGNTTAVTYMINYQCFERLAMSGDSAKSETVRNYFVKLREFLTDNHRVIYQAMTNKDELKKYSGLGSIYFFASDDRHDDIIKVGQTRDIITRLANYNVGRIKEIDLKYFALVKNEKIIEQCIKLKLKKNQIVKNREIFKIDPLDLKKIIDDCYCQYVTKKENDTMYEEIATLLGLYTYTKNKVNIKPYVIIDKHVEKKIEKPKKIAKPKKKSK